MPTPSTSLDHGDVRIWLGDAAACLRAMPAGIAQTCVTSPPFWGLRDYGTGTWEGGRDDCDHQAPTLPERKFTNGRGEGDDGYAGSNLRSWTTRDGTTYRAVCGRCGATRVDEQLGLEASPEAWAERLVAVFREVRRVLRDDGTVWLELGDSYTSGSSGERIAGMNARTGRRVGEAKQGQNDQARAPLAGVKPKDLVGAPWLLAFALRADGWYLRSEVIWAKPNPMPESTRDRPTRGHSTLFLLAKQPRYFYDADAIREPYSPMTTDTTQRRRMIAAEKFSSEDDFRPVHTGRQGDVGERMLSLNPAGRNARSVWTISTEPTPYAHFATFPQELVRRCIMAGSSQYGQCRACGAPWQRQTTRGHGEAFAGEAKDTGRPDGAERRNPRGGQKEWDGYVSPTTTGWAASCQCDAGSPVPQTVLDPFMGSGTTALVARNQGRYAIGCELNPDYLEIAHQRLAQLSLLTGDHDV